MTNEQVVEINNNLKNDKISIIGYNDFFDDTNCRFSLDETNKLQELKSILSRILIDDSLASVYVSMYYDKLEDVYKNMFWYSDTIILDTNMSVDEIEKYFVDCNFKPSNIIEQEEQLQFVSIDGKNNAFKNKRINVINIYWD
jgi:hypothetical protein